MAATKITIHSWVLGAMSEADSPLDHGNPKIHSVELPAPSCASDCDQAPPCIVQGIRPPAEPPQQYATIGFFQIMGGRTIWDLALIILLRGPMISWIPVFQSSFYGIRPSKKRRTSRILLLLSTSPRKVVLHPSAAFLHFNLLFWDIEVWGGVTL